jgi:hypothetical protein
VVQLLTASSSLPEKHVGSMSSLLVLRCEALLAVLLQGNTNLDRQVSHEDAQLHAKTP